MSESLETSGNYLESSKSNLQDLSQEEIKSRLKKLSQYRQDPVAFEYELVKLSKDWQTPIEECHHLWKIYENEFEPNIPLVKRKLKRWGNRIGKGLRFIVKYSILFGVIVFLAEAETRERQAVNAAWQVINDVNPENVTANAGRGDAAEFLNRGCIGEHQILFNISLDRRTSNVWRWFRNLPIVDSFSADCVNLKGLDLHKAHLLSINLPYANLQEAKFNGADLEGANLRMAQLQSSNFENANLQRVNISGFNSSQQTNLSHAVLTGANLSNANLSQVNLKNAQLGFANLEGTNLQGTDLTNTSLYGAFLSGAIYNSKTKPFEKLKDYMKSKGAYLIDTKSKLRGANLAGIDLRKANLDEAILEAASLQNANLRDANLTGANLKKVNFRGANLTAAALHNADVKGAIYDSETHIPDRFWQVFHKNAYLIDSNQDLSGADLRNMDLQEANLQGTVLKGANLEGANLRKANLWGANLTNANLQGAIADIDTKFPDNFNREGRGIYYLDSTVQLLSNAHLENADLEGIALVGANLQNSSLKGVNLRTADLYTAKLQYADLSNANLIYSSLKRTHFEDANLEDANLGGADLTSAYLSRASLRRANLGTANLNRADLTDVDLNGANLNGANLDGADLNGAQLTNINGLTREQIKQAKNWEKAKYDDDFRRLLELS